jgi:glycosyltransferase involved in cell wall biosynthesis
MAKLTIIVPVYNAQPWLTACIESILAQSEQDWRLTLVDDGSTDGSGAECDRFAAADERIEVLHTPNAGQSAARNLGLDRATTELILFVDADDCLHPDTLQTLLSVREASGADLCIGGFVYAIDYRFKPITKVPYRVVSPEEAIELALYRRQGFHNSPCNILYRRTLFNGIRFRHGVGYEDLDLFYHIYMHANKIAVTDRITYLYRDNPTSYLHTWQPGRQDVLDVTNRLVDWMDRHGTPALRRAARDRRFSAHYNMFVLAELHDDKALADRCWPVVSDGCLEALRNPLVRSKNKFGAILALFGRGVTSFVARHATL